MFYFYIHFNLFAVERTLSSNDDRVVTKAVTAGSAVSFNCTLDESCVNQSIDWVHYFASDNRAGIWYISGRLNPELKSSGITVEEDSARGWSVLSIPSASLYDSGRFHCVVPGLHHRCQMNFQLTVTGKLAKFNVNMGLRTGCAWL